MGSQPKIKEDKLPIKQQLLIFLAFCMPVSALAQTPTATKVTLTFNTTSDDKDWNSEMRANIVCKGLTVAALNCCNQNRQMDNWGNNSTTSRDILSPQPFAKGSLPGCTFNLGIVPVGNDTWVVIPTVQVFYTDGTTETFSFSEQRIIGMNSNYQGVSLPIQ